MSDVLVAVAWTALALGLLCAAGIAVDVARGRRQRMWIMNVVWPLTALYAGPLAVLAYVRLGRAPAPNAQRDAHDADQGGPTSSSRRSLPVAAALGATHCGSGCTLGDIVAEWLVVLFPVTLFGQRLFGTWVVDFVLAFLIGIAFQYYTIKPMRNLSASETLVAAIKADTASLVAWQVGMYGFMAFATFGIFHEEIAKTSPVFWFMMQIAMLAGFATSWPVNMWLIMRGIKERM